MTGLLRVLTLALLTSLVAWNAMRFRGAEQAVRTKDLSFLPSSEVAGVMACGHQNSLARLRWIDAFAYFQLQLDRKDDTVAGGGRGFERLYDTLIALDPQFVPFYQHAALAVGGILGRHDRELGYLMRGLLNRPHETQLWRHASSVLYTNFSWDQRMPEQMDHFLASWAASELDEVQRRQVWDWQAAMARRRFHGLQQLPYWLDRLAETTPRTPMGDYVEATLREQLTTYALGVLNGIAEERRKAGLRMDAIEQVLDVPRINAAGVDANWGPFANQDGRPVLRPDPYGFPYAWRDGQVVSEGMRLASFRRALLSSNLKLQGQQVSDLADLADLGITLPPSPPGVTVRVERGLLVADYPSPPEPPMALR